MLSTWLSATVAIAAFLLLVVLLALVRVRSKGKFTVETREIAAAIVAVGIGLFLSGELDEIAYGDFRLVRKISAEAKTPVNDRLRVKASTVQYTRRDEGEKRGVEQIRRFIRNRVDALSFQLGRRNYYYWSAIEQYFTKLTAAPYMRYVVFYGPDGRMKGLADARAIADRFRAKDPALTPRLFTRWVEQPDLKAIARLPGYVEPVAHNSSTREALSKMLEFGTNHVPVTDENGKFVGTADGSQLMGTLVNALAAAESRAR